MHVFESSIGSSQAQGLASALAGEIQVRRLAQRGDSVSSSSFGVVVGGAVPHAAVIPDGHVVLAPLEPQLGVVVLGHQVEEVVEKHVRLVLGDAVDALGEALVDVDRLPAGHSCKVSADVKDLRGAIAKGRLLTIGSDHRVNSLEVLASVQRRASSAFSDRVAETFGLIVEEVRIVGSCQALEELLHVGGQAVVDFIAGCPELLTVS